MVGVGGVDAAWCVGRAHSGDLRYRRASDRGRHASAWGHDAARSSPWAIRKAAAELQPARYNEGAYARFTS
jgi:hypothetical protein